ncbi:hypothetical protein LINPERHAP2_LOCUS27069 [Linum perenne]
MAKREISSTLKNLKFMQRGAAKVEKPKEKEEEVIPNGNFFSPGGVRKCVVVMEGDPHPGAVIGRMSFGSFNPSVDKLNDEATNSDSPGSAGQAAKSSVSRENGSSSADAPEPSETVTPNPNSGDQKRKQADVASERENSNMPGKAYESGEQSSLRNTKKGSFRQKRQKLDFNALRSKNRNN